MNFNKELLFVAGFIITVVVLIQYLSFILIKKQIKIEVSKRFSCEKSQKTTTESIHDMTPNATNINNNKNDEKDKNTDDESYDIDTPEELKSEGDSYVNPLRSEKNVTDEEDN